MCELLYMTQKSTCAAKRIHTRPVLLLIVTNGRRRTSKKDKRRRRRILQISKEEFKDIQDSLNFNNDVMHFNSNVLGLPEVQFY